MAPVPVVYRTAVVAKAGELRFPIECKDHDFGSIKESKKPPQEFLKRFPSCEYSVEADDERSSPCLAPLRVRLPPIESSGLGRTSSKESLPDDLSEDSSESSCMYVKGLKYEGEIGLKGEKKSSEPVENDDNIFKPNCWEQHIKSDFEEKDLIKKPCIHPGDKPWLEHEVVTVKYPVEHEHDAIEETKDLSLESEAQALDESDSEVVIIEEPKKIQKKIQRIRQNIGTKKRNVVWILDPEPENLPKKKKKTLIITQTTRKYQPNPAEKTNQIDNTVNLSSEQICLAVKKRTTRKSRVQKRPCLSLKTRKSLPRQNSSHNDVTGPPSLNFCSDSGLGSCNSYSSTGSTGNNSQDSSGNTDKSGGQNNEGFEGAGSSGGGGGNDGDENEDDKRPLSSGDVVMDDAEDKEEEEEQKEEERIVEDEAMPSQDNRSMCCKNVQVEQHQNVANANQQLMLLLQVLRHSYYCVGCDRPGCRQMKVENEHFSTDPNRLSCGRCSRFLVYLQYHAQQCRLPGCRVSHCIQFRDEANAAAAARPANNAQNVANRRPACAPPRPVLQARQPNYNAGVHQILQPGRVIYSSHPGIQLGSFFQEETDYCKEHVGCGKGANGEVFRLTTKSLGSGREQMVVKETEYGITDQELTVYREMGNHENIVKTHCVTIKNQENKANIFMEPCDMSVMDYLDYMRSKNTTMATGEAMFYWTQVLMAVDHLHERNIIHKDIKAKNVLLCTSPGQGELQRAKLADFDSARKLEHEFTVAGLKKMGTRGFAAPEVMEELPHGRPADVYNLGTFLVELLGSNPSENYATLLEQVRELSQIDPTGELESLVGSCVQINHIERPTTKQLLKLDFVRQFHQVPDEV